MGEDGMGMSVSLWANLPLLLRSNSKESLEYILQALWRTRKTGLDAADRSTISELLHLPSDSDLDPLLVCLRMLIRKSVLENTAKDDIQKLFPQEVMPELQRLLTLLLQKFQREWQEDVLKEKLRGDTQSPAEETGVKFQVAEDTLDTMLRSMYFTRDLTSSADDSSNGQGQAQKKGGA